MENNANIKARLLKNKEAIFDKIVAEISDAFDKNEKVRYIKDIEYCGTNMIFKATRDNWILSLNKARTFFESLEEYQKCKICRDLIKKISEHKSES